MSAPNCPEPASIPVERVREVLERLHGRVAYHHEGYVADAMRELGVPLDASEAPRESTLPPEHEATGGLTLSFQLDRDAEPTVAQTEERLQQLGTALDTLVTDWWEAVTADCGLQLGRPRSALTGAPPTPDTEELADKLDQEQRAHEQTRQTLVLATQELEWLRSVETASRVVLGVCNTVTGVAQTEERLQQLGTALDTLRAVLGGAPLTPSLETIASLIMLTSLRAGAQGRDFNAFEAATLVEAYLRGDKGQPMPGLSTLDGLRHQVWLQQWNDAGAAAREAQAMKVLTDAGVPAGVSVRPGVVSHFPADRVRYLVGLRRALETRIDEQTAAAAPFLQLARDRLARRSWEPIPDADCRRLLEAFDIAVPEVDRG